MANLRYTQSVFTYGELAPQLLARFDFDGYFKGLKTARNVIPIPQGGLQKRFGTEYVTTLSVTDPTQCDLSILNFEDNIIYVLVWQPLSIKIYLENILIATVTTTYTAADISNLRFSQAVNTIVVTNENFAPANLYRTDNSPNTVAGYVGSTSNYITLTSSVTAGQVLPIYFTTSGSLPTTVPQIYPGSTRTYFARTINTTHIRVYSTAADAAANINYYTVSAAGSSSAVVFQNTWTLSNIAFTYLPAYDFNGGYSALTFTPSATSGTTTLTASGPIYSAAFVGGLFVGNTGVMRLTVYTDTTHMDGVVLEDFPNTNAILGSLSFLGEPAWSDARGWPRISSYFQERSVFAGSPSLPNGIWLSTTNVGDNFDDSDIAPDNAISYYPQSGAGNYIQSITSAETLLVHGNLATYSSPAGVNTPATPTNFFLVEQNKDGISAVPAVHIDNQVIYLDSSNTNIKNLQFDIIQGKYVLNNISVSSSHLIVTPVDMSAYADPQFTDGAYVLVVNGNGTLAVYHTLIEQEINGWTLCSSSTLAGQSSFAHVANGIGSAWFLVQRSIHGSTVITLEELDFTSYTDCSTNFIGVDSSTLTGLTNLEGESVQVTADGNYLGTFTVSNSGTIALTEFGVPYTATNAQVGLPISWQVDPLPIAIQAEQGSTYYKPWHVRTFYVSYYQALGMYVNGFLIPEQDMRNFVLGQSLVPQNGVYQCSPMGSWDPFDPFADEIVISGSEPYPMTLIGIGYSLEV